MQVPNLLLEGIVGSTAYGLAHEGSDIDKKGIFAVDTNDLLGLNTPKDVYEQHAPEPDGTWYEAAKWAKLALKCNPNILELVYLPDDLYTHRTDLGDDLISIRKAFLSKDAVKNAYINYARSQLHEIEKRGDFGSDLKKRTEKHARHLVRLMMQGYQLYATGDLTVRLGWADATFVKGVGTQAGKGDLVPLRKAYDSYKEAFDDTETVLPDKPDLAPVESWLRHVRKRLLK
jgi:uncharacterized protein